ncbi:MAG: hypothetical protein HY775_06195 [Acidobacteria bacterium]|nr:hypothetical protein [Acidobacteriota bacterium]
MRQYREFDLRAAASVEPDGGRHAARIRELGLEATGSTADEAVANLEQALWEAATTTTDPGRRRQISDFMVAHSRAGTKEEYLADMRRAVEDVRE